MSKSKLKAIHKTSAHSATIVGAAHGLDLKAISSEKKIFAINSAYFYLQEKGINPTALITGDKRFIARTGIEAFKKIKVITFLDNDEETNDLHRRSIPNLELYQCLGRDGFSSDFNAGFYHGCSTFFFAVQYLVSMGYTEIDTVGVNFPPPEMYARVSGVVGHPEFVYDIQLKNLHSLKKFLNSTNTEVNCLDKNSNLSIFL